MGPTTYLKQLAPGDFSTGFDPGKRIIYNAMPSGTTPMAWAAAR